MVATRSLADAKAHFSECVSSAEAGERVAITRHGKLAAVVIGPADWERLQQSPPPSRRGLMFLIGDCPDGEQWAETLAKIVAERTVGRDVPNPS